MIASFKPRVELLEDRLVADATAVAQPVVMLAPPPTDNTPMILIAHQGLHESTRTGFYELNKLKDVR